MSELAVITIVHGRRDHLERQHEALAASGDRDFHRVVVAMDDPTLARWRPETGPVVDLVVAPPSTRGLPLAAARNAGARRALALGARVLVFLDVDCLPAAGLVASYRSAAARPETAGTLMCGPVAYLPPPGPDGYDLDDLERLAQPHPARPAPPVGEVVVGGDHDLFWSLSFALRAETWRMIGGFCDRYAGYGGEDTDLGAKARALDVPLSWIGAARSFHQHHETQSPPRQHLDELWDNALVFHARWGRWPMTGWLDAFVEEGLLVRAGEGYARPGGPRRAAGPAPAPPPAAA